MAWERLSDADERSGIPRPWVVVFGSGALTTDEKAFNAKRVWCVCAVTATPKCMEALAISPAQGGTPLLAVRLVARYGHLPSCKKAMDLTTYMERGS